MSKFGQNSVITDVKLIENKFSLVQQTYVFCLNMAYREPSAITRTFGAIWKHIIQYEVK